MSSSKVPWVQDIFGGTMIAVRVWGVGAIIAIAASSIVAAPASAADEAEASYIVELAPAASVDQVSSEVLDGDEPTETYSDLLNGFAAELTPSEVAELESSPEVVAVYEDFPVSVGTTQSDAPWNLSRLDESTAPADAFYTYPDSAGSGTRIYIVDTGIAPNAAQFGSRLLSGVTTIADGRGTTDCNGHGTHVAGTAASASYGVAKQALVVLVRVFGCSGDATINAVLQGLEWIVTNHPAGTPGIVNLSLGSNGTIPANQDLLSQEINDMANLGFVMVVAAGNSNADACSYSPSRAANALTVGATQTNDSRASFSNFGTCLDVFAPGTSIRSLQWNSPSGSMLMQGTSMAAPHVAGIAALAWGASPSSTASAISAQVVAQAIPDVVTNQGAGSTRSLSSIATLNAGAVEYPTTPGAVAMLRLYFASGAAAGPLGTPNSALTGVTCAQNATSCRIDFANGIISWGSSTGAFSILNPFAPYWTTGSNSTALGSPTATATPWTAGGVSGNLQNFQRGMVLSSTTTGTFAVLNGPIRNTWGSYGGSGGSLGWPIGDQITTASGFEQAFQRGTIYASTSGSGGVLSGAIATYWTTGSNSTALGSPTATATPWTAEIGRASRRERVWYLV
jgi:subtilisin family serine protease